jgi:hypothetical protein
MWRSEEETPSRLFPKTNKSGTASPIKGPPTYQGQGFFIHSIMTTQISFNESTKFAGDKLKDQTNQHRC